ncbi:hypothetical protein [Actinoplanes sp. DH11]|uniref:hypothetical protein n=1 Tax=Actinoplanes sp. DH11 TaxID=2857011 RepID=UPI001E4414ED|nr:hypothetical protein [Actinoplanes sp. DH11]
MAVLVLGATYDPDRTRRRRPHRPARRRCLLGSDRATMMAGWDPTPHAGGAGHHGFVLPDGDIATSPPAGFE